MDDMKRLNTSLKSMEKAAALKEAIKLQKTASPSLLLGGGAGYLKGVDSGRGAEGAVKGALGTSLGGTAGGLLSLPVAAALADNKIRNNPDLLKAIRGRGNRLAALGPKSIAAVLLGVGGGSLAGYKALTKGVDKPKKKVKTGAAQKLTFSKAMDDSPHLKGKQSTLPDQIQAKILKGKMRKSLKEKMQDKQKHASMVSLSGLQYASSALYEDVYAKRGLQKHAFAQIFPSLGKGVARYAAGGAALGGLAGGARRLQQLRTLASEGAEGLAARKAFGTKWREAMANRSAAIKGGQTYNVPKSLQQEADFLRGVKGLKGKTFKDNPMDFLKVYGPEVARAALESGGAAALASGGGRAAANMMKRKKMLDTAKAVAVPAALGLGGYALLSN